MAKGEVAAEFLLQEGTIGVLPFLERRNPRNPKFQMMKLYLRKQVRTTVINIVRQGSSRWKGKGQVDGDRRGSPAAGCVGAVVVTGSREVLCEMGRARGA